MKKCILLSRVSTQQQTLEQQTNELLKFAKNRGYDDKHIIVIEDKESAIKLDEEHRKGLTKMKEHITNDKTINCVICYEISRISRQQKVLFSIRDYLKERKIQLVILKPYMELLDGKGEITPTANIVFSLFSTLSENEMMLKTERMQRGRRQKKSEGKYGGGKILLGYKIGKDEMIEVDEEKAKVVKKIFDLYEEGYSGGSIAREMLDRGWIDSKNTSSALILVNRTLRNKRYIGINDGFDTQYPSIITVEQFNRCRDLVKNHTKRNYTNVSFIYYAQNLLRSKENGRVLTPCKTTGIYSMYEPNEKKYMLINISIADSVIWHVVKQHKIDTANIDVRARKGEMTHRYRIYKSKIRTAKDTINHLNQEIERIENRIISGKMDETRGDKQIAERTEEIKRLTGDSDKWQYESENLMNEINNISTKGVKRDYKKIKDDNEIRNIIHQDLEVIWISKEEEHAVHKLEFVFKDGQTKTYILKHNGKVRKLWDDKGNEIEFEFNERVKRKRY